MAGLSVFDWNKTPASNSDVNNVGISGGDNVSSGDDALRAILGLVSQYNRDLVGLGQTLGGTANAITLTINQAWASLADGQILAFKNTSGPNSGATTLAVTNSAASSLGTKAIRLNGDTALTGGEMLDEGIYLLRYVASYNSAAGAWCLLNSSSGPAPIFADDAFYIKGSSDATKRLRFEVDGLTTGNDRVATPPDSNFKMAALDVAAQVVTGGGRITSNAVGTVSSGTTTLDPGTRPMWDYTNNGAHTLAPGSNTGSIILDITNGASAGAITTSGWTKVVGAFDTTNTHKFRCSCTIGAAGSLLSIQALF